MTLTELYRVIKHDLADGRTAEAMDRLRAALPTVEQQRPDYYHPAILLLNDYRELSKRSIQGLDVRASEEQALTARLLTLSRDLSAEPLPTIPAGTNPLEPVLDGTTPAPEIHPTPPVADRPAPRINYRVLGVIAFLFVGLAVANVFYERYQRKQLDGPPLTLDESAPPPTQEVPVAEPPVRGDDGVATDGEVVAGSDGRVSTLYLKQLLANQQFHTPDYRKLRFAASGDRGMTPDYKFTLDRFDGSTRTATGTFLDSNTRPLGQIWLQLDPDGRGVSVRLRSTKGRETRERYTK